MLENAGDVFGPIVAVGFGTAVDPGKYNIQRKGQSIFSIKALQSRAPNIKRKQIMEKAIKGMGILCQEAVTMPRVSRMMVARAAHSAPLMAGILGVSHLLHSQKTDQF